MIPVAHYIATKTIYKVGTGMEKITVSTAPLLWWDHRGINSMGARAMADSVMELREIEEEGG